MASFSIQELLGLGKDNSSSKSEDNISELAAAKNSKDGANNKPRAAPPPAGAAPEVEAEDIDHNIDVETLDEESNAELVSRVEVRRTVYTTSPASVSRASRKRKRSKQAEETPAKSDGKPPKFNSG